MQWMNDAYGLYVTVHAYVPSNGICRGSAFKYGKFLAATTFSYGTFGSKSAYPCTVTIVQCKKEVQSK